MTQKRGSTALVKRDMNSWTTKRAVKVRAGERG